MPFDGLLFPGNPELAKINKIIAFYTGPGKWIQGQFSDESGRRCLAGVIHRFGLSDSIQEPILEAAEEITGTRFRKIPDFNDDSATTFSVLMRVLYRARRNLGGPDDADLADSARDVVPAPAPAVSARRSKAIAFAAAFFLILTGGFSVG